MMVIWQSRGGDHREHPLNLAEKVFKAPIAYRQLLAKVLSVGEKKKSLVLKTQMQLTYILSQLLILAASNVMSTRASFRF